MMNRSFLPVVDGAFAGGVGTDDGALLLVSPKSTRSINEDSFC